MIFDVLDNRERRFTGPAWTLAFEFLDSLREDAEVGEYFLKGKEIRAIVAEYATKPLTGDSAPEAHRDYVDIQMLLSGAERILWYPLAELSRQRGEYDPEKDIVFYHLPEGAENAPQAQLTLTRGAYAVFFPNDAHLPALALGDDVTNVKKVVIKMRVDHV